MINDINSYQRAEILLEKGTNRLEFFRGEGDKYGWVDIGSSYLPSDYTAAVLFSQLEELAVITEKRKLLYKRYCDNLSSLNNRFLKLPIIPDYGIFHNAHIFYIILENIEQRDMLIKELKSFNIFPAFHYISLHKSKFNLGYSKNIETLNNSDIFSDCLLRLPMYFELTESQVDFICEKIHLLLK